ncbi:MarR family winged helix-turn-helix transcriptional regulator [Metabacillus arenae]|uniref:MarR family transcriptional regulator n=1 Tax=Metabacillus arenae TaxID=2771434 RepID=A0A926NF38_9BACI|nr:MarR family transcriptional regulator [Metabacillus arenae]MBD1382319.1 MarR family transcriptional regulator [Metabacillus arenae]
MREKEIQDLINRYLDVSFSVQKKAENLIKGEIGADLTNDQHYTLRYIKKKEICTSTELAQIFDVNKSAITAIINRLAEKNLIERRRDKNDRRVVYLKLSNEGEQLFNNAEGKICDLVGSLLTKFDHHEIASFIETYEKLNTVLEDYKKMEDEL